MHEWVPIIVALITGLSSAPVWNVISRRFGWNQTEMDRLRQEVRDASARHEACEQQVRDLNDRIAIIEHHHSSAFARWLLDGRKRIVWVNAKALVSIFGPMGLARDQIEGKSFRDLIDKHAADELDRLVAAALTHDGAAVSNLIRLHPDLPLMHVVKIATSGRGGELIFEAIAFRTNDADVVIGFGVGRNAAQRVTSIDHLAQEPPAN